MKHLKLFETTNEYNAATLDLPNVSLIEENMSIYYNPYVLETKLVVYYDIQDISNSTIVCTNYDSSFKSMEINGDVSVDITTQGNITYQFDSVGEHIIKYEFNNPTQIGDSAPLFHQISYIKRVVIPNVFTSIGNNAFNSCYGLTSIVISNSVTSINQGAFINCTSLTSIDIPDSVTSIGNNVFYGCSCLTSIVIPDSVTSISYGVFYDCNSLTSITSNAMTAPTIANGTFQNVKTGGTLTVPQGSSGYDTWMQNANYYLGLYNWTKVEQ